MSIVVTGATGHLGRLVVAALRDRLPAGRTVAAVRDPGRAADLGVEVREADYDRPDTLARAFAGADALLLISSSANGRRVEQHRHVIDAARAAGVGHLVYTSATHADDTTLLVAPEHAATEQLVRASGLPFTVLRNNWYTENYLPAAQQAVATGTLAGSTGGGRIASATRADYAAGAAAVLTTGGHAGRTYELSGDVAWTLDDLADALTTLTGRPVAHHDLSPAEHRAALVAAGMPEATADFVVAIDRSVASGALADATADLRTLIGRPTTPLADGLTTALENA